MLFLPDGNARLQLIDDVPARLEAVSSVRARYRDAHSGLSNLEGPDAMKCRHPENRPLSERIVHDLGNLGACDASVCLVLEKAHILATT